MAHQQQSNNILDAVQLLADHGFDEMSQALQILFNEAMKLERSEYLGAEPYQRSVTRRSYANGFQAEINSKVASESWNCRCPRHATATFIPLHWSAANGVERALKLAIAEMYVQGVSTRKVAKITTELCGFDVTSTQVSRAAKLLDEELETWRNRPLGQVEYLILDARYEKVRVEGSVRDCAVLIAIGVLASGHRSVLGVSVSLSEAEVHWREFLGSLNQRGLHGVKLIVSDAHEGLKAARQNMLAGTPWQRCQFHLMQNAMQYVPKVHLRKQVSEELRNIFNARDLDDALNELKRFVSTHEKTAPKLASWAEENIPEGLTVFTIPAGHRKRMRTTNMLERQNKELKRRTRVAGLFPNEESLLRLVTAVLVELSDDWETGMRYLTI
ncbi:Transposase, Mutator family [Gimesia panareensis]|uniref:Mutator family transposase n=2 Tax=Gimesia panareensis TaxID=2527978 RepID=A0A517Q3R0_9PLAN|nr:IS256 family transposase [Gimesia panareensis]QDT24749.1 Transposase, Mutator family [Gimesia panareensis]QDT24810.1 Transposase, Mutator family [Gimesia panareensis]QDT26266.1 Transposase, Mutator family [Gimesia panareensis]QDT26904.1 Transposase, Mutator family [Gimesia panareensis]QDT27865.1 Transposase, Mutator family [Gimesia panareensis]